MLGFLFVELYETIKSIAIVNRERGRAVLWEFSVALLLQKCSVFARCTVVQPLNFFPPRGYWNTIYGDFCST